MFGGGEAEKDEQGDRDRPPQTRVRARENRHGEGLSGIDQAAKPLGRVQVCGVRERVGGEPVESRRHGPGGEVIKRAVGDDAVAGEFAEARAEGADAARRNQTPSRRAENLLERAIGTARWTGWLRRRDDERADAAAARREPAAEGGAGGGGEPRAGAGGAHAPARAAGRRCWRPVAKNPRCLVAAAAMQVSGNERPGAGEGTREAAGASDVGRGRAGGGAKANADNDPGLRKKAKRRGRRRVTNKNDCAEQVLIPNPMLVLLYVDFLRTVCPFRFYSSTMYLSNYTDQEQEAPSLRTTTYTTHGDRIFWRRL
mmetsp:Transcript_25177/g.63359  ORF Transcript_25177/g.63359 Transcript_25177/m.63359 type:complete len:313 (+) Transcript_25177:1597-2535(+)